MLQLRAGRWESTMTDWNIYVHPQIYAHIASQRLPRVGLLPDSGLFDLDDDYRGMSLGDLVAVDEFADGRRTGVPTKMYRVAGYSHHSSIRDGLERCGYEDIVDGAASSLDEAVGLFSCKPGADLREARFGFVVATLVPLKDTPVREDELRWTD